jgi:RNA polymerase sigma factor (sigma-70 family)
MHIDEDEFRGMLSRYHACEGGEREAIGAEIVARISVYFQEVLRPALGRQFGHSVEDTSVRYSVMVNDFFARVLDGAPDVDRFWRVESLRALRAFASTVIANDIRDVLRRQKKRTSVEEGDFEDLLELAKGRAEHFQGKHDLDLEPALDRLDEWRRRGAPWDQRARVIGYRYIDGMDYDEIADQEGVTTKQAYRIRETAIEALRRELGP